MRRRMRLDHWGMALSSLCTVHCLTIPALFALLPSLTLALHSFEAPMRPWALLLLRLQAYDGILAGAALLLALLSFRAGWRRHRCGRPFLWLLAAAVIFWIGLYAIRSPSGLHGMALAMGGVLLVIGHASNLRLLRSCFDAHAGVRGSW